MVGQIAKEKPLVVAGIEVHHHIIDKIALFNGFISGIALYPQAVKILLSGGGESLSFISYLLIFLNSIVWALYAIHRRLIALFIASFFNALAALVLVFFALG